MQGLQQQDPKGSTGRRCAAAHLSRICMCSSCARNAALWSSDMPATASGEKFILAAAWLVAVALFAGDPACWLFNTWAF